MIDIHSHTEYAKKGEEPRNNYSHTKNVMLNKSLSQREPFTINIMQCVPQSLPDKLL